MEYRVLSNGLRVVVDPIHHLETAAVGLWVSTGSRHENPAHHGVSHALEHMLFKGTKNRTARQIAEDMENVGAYLNAYTSREVTAFHARTLKQHVPLAVEMLSDMILNSTFPDEEWQREYKVIHQEIGQSEDTPDDIIFDYAQTEAYPDQALGRCVLGSYQTVESLNGDVFRSYMQQRYRPENSVFVLSGGIDPEQAYDWVQQFWGAYGTSNTPASNTPYPSAHYRGGARHVSRDLEQLHIVMGFEGVTSLNVSERFTVGLLSSALGGGMSSRLFQKIREEQGLVYSIYSFHSDFQDSGFLGIYAGTGPEHYDQIMQMTRQICQDVSHTLKPEELERARTQMKASLMMSWESPRHRCESLAYQMLNRGQLMSPQQMIQIIDGITLHDAQTLGQRIFSSPETLVTLGSLTYN